MVTAPSHLKPHFNGKDDSEDVVKDVQDLPLKWPGRDVGPLHRQGDAVAGDEDKHDEVEPGFAGQVTAPHPEPVQDKTHLVLDTDHWMLQDKWNIILYWNFFCYKLVLDGFDQLLSLALSTD